ncbi:MAG: PAC2 family protein [Chitinispirillaceae bacterium]
MADQDIITSTLKPLEEGTLLLGFGGWLNDGEISQGTVNYLIDTLGAVPAGRINADDLYIISHSENRQSFISPTCSVEKGIISEFSFAENMFYHIPGSSLVFLLGMEPNMKWDTYAGAIFSFCRQKNIRRILFIGSLRGYAPHTREPKIHFLASDPAMRDELLDMGIEAIDYIGQASIVSYLTHLASLEKIPMAALFEEIPAYLEGYNPRGVETAVKLAGRLLDTEIDMSVIQEICSSYDKRIEELIKDQPELEEKIRELEREYDEDAFEREFISE